MIACAESGADAVDACCDAVAGLTSQPHMGAIINEFRGTELDTGIDLEQMMHLNTYWEVPPLTTDLLPLLTPYLLPLLTP